MVIFSSQAYVVFTFNTYCDIASIDQTIFAQQYHGAGCPGAYIGHGLLTTKDYLFGCSDRPHVPKVLVVVTAGTSLDDVYLPAFALGSNGVKIFCIGVGDYYNEGQLQAMASHPHSEHIFRTDFDQIADNTSKQVAAKIVRG